MREVSSSMTVNKFVSILAPAKYKRLEGAEGSQRDAYGRYIKRPSEARAHIIYKLGILDTFQNQPICEYYLQLRRLPFSAHPY